MGFFLNKKNDKIDVELDNAHKYVETLFCKTKEELDKEIAKRIENGRIIKSVDFEVVSSDTALENCCAFSAMILYDTWAEKARNEKENSKEIEL